MKLFRVMHGRARQPVGCLLIALTALVATVPTANAAIEIDQIQPFINEGLSGASRFTWQQGVTAGLQGKLVGFELYSNQVGTANVFLNLGAPWQSDSHDWVGTITSLGAGADYVDVSAANIMLNPGDQFSIGFNGQNVLGVLGLGALQPADAYLGGGAFHSDSVLSTITGPFRVIAGRVFNLDLAFATYVEVEDLPPFSAVPELSGAIIWSCLALCALTIYGRSRLVPTDN